MGGDDAEAVGTGAGTVVAGAMIDEQAMSAMKDVD